MYDGAEAGSIASGHGISGGVASAVLLLVFFLICARPLLEPVGADVTNKKITGSALLPVASWCVSWPMVAWPHPRDKSAGRSLWTLGCSFLLLHIAIAFHLGHGWSHGAAWEHTRQVGGYGDGIFVNYAFALVWLADVIWMWAAFRSYLGRPRWLKCAIHGFLAFVVFNAAVVFADWGLRLLFLTWFLGFAGAIYYVRRTAVSGGTSSVDTQ